MCIRDRPHGSCRRSTSAYGGECTSERRYGPVSYTHLDVYKRQPLFDRVEITVQGGTFTIVAEKNSAANKYIQRVWLNGQPYTKPWIGHADVMKGGAEKNSKEYVHHNCRYRHTHRIYGS